MSFSESIKEKVISILKTVIDPDLKTDIVSAGFVKSVSCDDDGVVNLIIELTIPTCPLKNQFKEEIEAKVFSVPGVKKINIQFTSRQRNVSPHQQQVTLNNIHSIIAISACKGGVGKSTISAYLARALQRCGLRVGLLDLDMYGPSLPTLMNKVHADVVMIDEKLLPVEIDGLLTMSLGYILGDSPAVLRGPLVSTYTTQLLHQTEWGPLDFLIIDLPPGTGDIQLTLLQQIALDGAIIVTTPQTLSLVDVSRGILMFEKLRVPVLGIVENMSYFICDNCGKKHFLFGNGTDDLQQRFGLPILANIPILHNFHDASTKNAGQEHDTTWKPLIEQIQREIGKRRANTLSSPEVQVKGKNLIIDWKDGKFSTISLVELRRACRCAYCVDELTGQPLLKQENIPEDIKVEQFQLLGHYAISIFWSDGHTSSIYPWEFLKKLSPPKS
ncbi:MAG TPA: P-loop NTPase [Candidatus Hydrogenedens sp.]|nr:P-loop NTPase [Candidatus Hydrogenedens sp.]HOL19118.1 P-loop NTPase [Candidatus Hydrogenedens sp.]HPP58064.1 P-loop NTPase [Candidatus Hydrogenedens sp.]